MHAGVEPPAPVEVDDELDTALLLDAATVLAA
jgi:hypothetical protein